MPPFFFVAAPHGTDLPLCYVDRVYDPKADKEMRDEGNVVLPHSNRTAAKPLTLNIIVSLRENYFALSYDAWRHAIV